MARSYGKRILILMAACLLFLASCHGGKAGDGKVVQGHLSEEKSEWCYCLDRSFELPWDEGKDSSLTCFRDALYYVETEIFWDGKIVAQDEMEELMQELEQNPEVKKTVSLKSSVVRRKMSDEGLEDGEVVFQTEDYVEAVRPTTGGNIYLITGTLSDILDLKNDRKLLLADDKGIVKMKKDVTDYYQPGFMAVDGKGCIAFWHESMLTILDDKGSRKKEEALQGPVLVLSGMQEGGFVASVMGAEGVEFRAFSAEKGMVGRSYAGVADAYEAASDENGRLILGGHSGIYELERESGDSRKLNKWLELDILYDDVIQWWLLEDDRIGVILLNDFGTDRTVLTLQRIRREDLAQKETLILGTWGSVGSFLERTILSYNRTHTKYRVEVLDYTEELHSGNSDAEAYEAARNRQEQDILSGTGPELMLSGSIIDFTKYADKGVFEDLEPYLMRGGELSQEDFWEEALDASRWNGSLIQLPRTFSIQTLVCKEKLLKEGLRDGLKEVSEGVLKRPSEWKAQDFLSVMEAHPGAEAAQYSALYEKEGVTGRAGQIMELALLLNQEYFAGENGKDCRFDEELFESLLNFGTEQGRLEQHKEYQYELYEKDQRIFYRTVISSYADIDNLKQIFGDIGISFPGFPSELGQRNHILIPREGMMILSAADSEKKEAAWEFLVYYLRSGESDTNADCFSARKDVFAEKKQEALLASEQSGRENGECMDLNIVEELLHSSIGKNETMDGTILRIIDEEAQPVFQGQKTAKDAAQIIQGRVVLYLQEN